MSGAGSDSSEGKSRIEVSASAAGAELNGASIAARTEEQVDAELTPAQA